MRRARLQPAPGRSSAAASSRARGRRATRARVNAVLADGSLAITFQPIVALDDGRHVGSEALARFPDLQGRPTEEWFADAASVGLQTELELAAVNAALDRLGDLPPYAFMSVNVSPTALLASSVRERLLHAPLRRIVVEITEHEQVCDYDALNAALAELRAAGAMIAIDDAGAGFASLRHVLQLDPDVIKIDRSLTAGLDTRTGRALVAALVSFAAEMGQIVIVEGIESAAAVDQVRSFGACWGQGFFLGRPGVLD